MMVVIMRRNGSVLRPAAPRSQLTSARRPRADGGAGRQLASAGASVFADTGGVGRHASPGSTTNV